jgi:hypothetical protein
MEPTMKTVTSTAAQVAPVLLVDAAAALDGAAGFPVAQALAAIGEPDTTGELAQRLAATVAMLWADVAAADLFLPQPGSGELRGVRDGSAGVSLLSAVATAPYGDQAGVRVIPVTPALVQADPGAARGSSISAPVVSGAAGAAGATIDGFVIVQRRPSAPDFSARDAEALAALARGIGEILPRVRARGGRSAAAWLQRDMASAREMQRMFLPQPLQSNSAGARVLAEYRPAFEVGGDFYDCVDLGNGRLLAAIGDVSGKGVTAALMMSRISSELHRITAETASPADILARLNRSLRGGMQDDRFVTVVCVLLDMPGRRWVVANAGHVVPMLRRRSGVISGLAYASGPPIGMLQNPQYEDEVFALEPRDILVLATDGVFEMLSGHRRPCSTMGQCKLTEVVEKAPHDLAEIHRRILYAVESASGRDDVALLGLELPE